MLELKNVSKFYYSKNAVASGFSKINLKLNMGEFIAITGESGSGKSTLLNVISGLDSFEEGEMYLNGEELSGYTEKDYEEYRKKYIGNIFQNFNLVNSYTVYQNVELVLLINGYKKRKVKKKILKVLEQVGLLKFKNTKVSKLSGGQKQRVAIARALIKETPIIVADEPTGNLDSQSAKNVLELLYKVAKDKLVLIVSHNYEQIEKYTTRKIVMHDGKIIEDKKLKNIGDRINDEEVDVNFNLSEIPKAQNKKKNISLVDKIRLGLRNTFNIKIKFILLLFVFIFLSLTVFGEYTTYQKQQYEESIFGYSPFFSDTSPERLVIKKENNSEITEEDYAKLNEIGNIDKIIKNDILIDNSIGLEPTTSGNVMYLFGNSKNIEELEGIKLEYGTYPEAENEIVLIGSKSDYTFRDPEFMIGKTYRVSDYSETVNNAGIMELKIVGIAFNEDINNRMEIYLSESILNSLRTNLNKGLSEFTYIFNGQKSKDGEQYTILGSPNVDPGKAIVPYEMHYGTQYTNATNYPISMTVENMYYTEVLDVTIQTAYTKSNMQRLLGLDYEDLLDNMSYNYMGEKPEKLTYIYINETEYKNLFEKANYQSSIYIKDIELLEETKEKLDNLGYTYIYPLDTINNDSEFAIISRAIMSIVLVVVAIVVFFIAYFVIRIILKSRNVYFATIRILGATRKNAKTLLNIELLTVMHIAYGIILVLISLIQNNIISNNTILEYIEYLKLGDYIFVYIVLVLMSLLISNRYSNKLFKDSAIKTHRIEEV